MVPYEPTNEAANLPALAAGRYEHAYMTGVGTARFCQADVGSARAQNSQRVDRRLRPEPGNVCGVRVERPLPRGQRVIKCQHPRTVQRHPVLLDREPELSGADLVTADYVMLVVAGVAEPVGLGVLMVVAPIRRLRP